MSRFIQWMKCKLGQHDNICRLFEFKHRSTIRGRCVFCRRSFDWGIDKAPAKDGE